MQDRSSDLLVSLKAPEMWNFDVGKCVGKLLCRNFI